MHRVLLDFKCSGADLEPHGDDVDPNSDVIRRLRSVLVEDGWETHKGSEEDQIVNRMAVQLPDSDLPSFVRSTKHAMSRHGPHAELTLGYSLDNSVGRVRIRIRSDIDAMLADLARSTADMVIESVPELTLIQMDLYQERHDQPIVQGAEERHEGFRLLTISALPIAAPLVVSFGYLTIGAWIAHMLYWHHRGGEIMGETLWVWYGRLYGPMFMALIGSIALLIRERRENPSRRLAMWKTTET